jgi:hypothetical protein
MRSIGLVVSLNRLKYKAVIINQPELVRFFLFGNIYFAGQGMAASRGTTQYLATEIPIYPMPVMCWLEYSPHGRLS